jgi:hypothetical protein
VRTSKNLFTEDRKDHEDNPFDERANAWSQLFSGPEPRLGCGGSAESSRSQKDLPKIVTEAQFLIGLCTTDVQYRAI